MTDVIKPEEVMDVPKNITYYIPVYKMSGGDWYAQMMQRHLVDAQASLQNMTYKEDGRIIKVILPVTAPKEQS